MKYIAIMALLFAIYPTHLLASMPHHDHATGNVSISATQNVTHIMIKVKGVVCPFCAQGLEKSFKKLAITSSVSVDLDNQLVHLYLTPNATIDDETITKMVTNAGFNVEAIYNHEPTVD